MSKMMRLSKTETKALNDKCIEINKLLIKENKAPVKDSELVHLILIDAIKRTKVNIRGEVLID